MREKNLGFLIKECYVISRYHLTRKQQAKYPKRETRKGDFLQGSTHRICAAWQLTFTYKESSLKGHQKVRLLKITNITNKRNVT